MESSHPAYSGVANYIQHHMSENITVEKLAKELFLSRPYLSRRFKEETGESLTDFILKEKTEEAKRLLRYSGKSLTAIGNYLGFSSRVISRGYLKNMPRCNIVKISCQFIFVHFVVKFK